MFIELHAQSAFSFLEGAELPEAYAAAAARLGMPAVALCDRDGVYGAPRFTRAALDAGVKPIIGSEITLTDGSRLPLLVEDREGYQNLCHLITRMKLGAAKGSAAVTLAELAPYAAGLVCLTGGAYGPLALRLDAGDAAGARGAPRPGRTPLAHLRELVARGVRARYGTGPLAPRARRQVAHEIDVIGRLDLAGYFLIVWDIVEYCRANDILVQGRGSAANSAVCYALGITAVDPVGMELLFERFLSEARGEWPDIDLDLPSGARREAVIQHVYQRYGRLGAGMTANVITYRGRSAAREVGKALGLPRDMQDRLARFVPNWGYQDAADQLTKHLAEAGCDTRHPRIRHFAALWMRIQDLPRHLGQHSGGMVIAAGRLDNVVPLEPATMPGRVVVQWDKDDCAGLGIIKIDLLGLGMVAAGFTATEAEELRRAFGFKRSERLMADVETKLHAGMARQGIHGAAAEEIVHAITSFALYGFPESHASSFALLAYASAYLKVHHPAAFYAALLNNQPMGFYHPATIVKDAQRHGLRILPV